MTMLRVADITFALSGPLSMYSTVHRVEVYTLYLAQGSTDQSIPLPSVSGNAHTESIPYLQYMAAAHTDTDGIFGPSVPK